ncbi:glycosyltransferase family 39 protein [bacterium]|nr:glycosyltransferase family 39 protein [bacterium]
MLQLDTSLFLFINHLHHPILDWFFRTITDIGNFRIPIALLAALIVWKGNSRHRILLLLIVAAVGLSDMLGQDIKELVRRPRPYLALDNFRFPTGYFTESKSFAFPSNHASNVFAAAAAIACFFWKRKWIGAVALFLAALVGWSRIYVGVHYPLDVAGGALLGVTCGTGLFLLERRFPLIDRRPARLAPNWTGLLIFVLLFVTAYRFSAIVDPDNLLCAEEAQYWDWSRNLDWSYYSKPPLIAAFIRAGTVLFGQNEFGVRIGALTATLLLAAVTWLFVRDLFGSKRVTFFVLLLMCVIPLFDIGAIIHTTDTPLMLFWGLALYTFYRGIFRGENLSWLLAGVFLGLGFLSKYAMIYLPFCLLLYLLVTPAHRRWLRRPQPYLAGLIGLLLFTPVFIWNIRENFVAFRHVAGQATTKSGMSFCPGCFLEFLGSQFGVISPIIFAGMLVAAWMAFRGKSDAPVSVRDNRVRFLLCTSIPIFLLLLTKSLLGKVQANWAAPAYYSWTILVVYIFDRWYEKRPRPIAIWAALGIAIALAISLFIHEPGPIRDKNTVRFLQSVGVEEPHKLDPTWRLQGWDDLGEAVGHLRDSMPRPDNTFIFTDEYQEAALLAFYTEGNPRTYNVNYGRRMNQYDLWPGPEERPVGSDAVFVTEKDKKGKWRKRVEKASRSFIRMDEPLIVDLTLKKRVYHTYVIVALYDFAGTVVSEAETSNF